jgi:hypothetical protein
MLTYQHDAGAITHGFDIASGEAAPLTTTAGENRAVPKGMTGLTKESKPGLVAPCAVVTCRVMPTTC